MRRTKKLILWGLGFVTLIIAGFLSIVLTVGININLGLFSGKIGGLLGEIINSPVTINGPVIFTASRTPSLLVKEISIKNTQRNGSKVRIKRIDIRLSSIPLWVPTDINAEIEFDKGGISLSGLITDPAELKGLDIKVVLLTKQLESINFFTKETIPEFGQIQLKGNFRDSETGFELTDIQGNVDNIVFTGSLGLDVSSKLPRVVTNVVITNLDLKKYGKRYAERNSGRKQLEPSGVPEIYKLLSHFNIDLKLNIESLRYAQLELSKLQVNAKMAEQKLNVDRYKFSYQDNVYTGVASIDLDDVMVKSGIEKIAVLPLDLTINHTDKTVTMKGEITQPFRSDRVNFYINANGQNLARLSPILNYELPEVGPYDLKGQLRIADKKIRLTKLTGHIGKSAFTGNLSIKLNKKRPKFVIFLASDRIDINDFIPKKIKTRAEWVRNIKSGSSDIDDGILKPADLKILRKFDAHVSVKIKELNNLEDKIRNITATLNLHDGLLKIDPLDVTFPEGRIDTTLVIDARSEIFNASVSFKAERFDYGSLVRILRSDARGEGWLNADIKLNARGKSPQELLATTNGHINIVIWPENLSTDFMDIWTQGLLLKVFDTLDPNAKSKMNCIIAYFDVKDGVMESNRIVLDTSRIKVDGTGTFDLKTRRLDFILSPSPKTPAYTSTSIPITIKGKLPDYEIKPKTGGVVGGIVKLYTNAIVVPYQYMVHGKIPKDGRLVCGEKE